MYLVHAIMKIKKKNSQSDPDNAGGRGGVELLFEGGSYQFFLLGNKGQLVFFSGGGGGGGGGGPGTLHPLPALSPPHIRVSNSLNSHKLHRPPD